MPNNPVPGEAWGGGVFRIRGLLAATARVDGSLTANGNPGLSPGAGGSVWITAGALAGGGAITARGGDGEWFNGGGGGGGRIAIYTPTDTHRGIVCAQAGLGAASGQAGTVVRGESPRFDLALIPANGGHLRLAWRGCERVVYQIQGSDDLAHWTEFGAPLTGVNDWMEVHLPLEPVPARFYRLRATP